MGQAGWLDCELYARLLLCFGARGYSTRKWNSSRGAQINREEKIDDKNFLPVFVAALSESVHKILRLFARNYSRFNFGFAVSMNSDGMRQFRSNEIISDDDTVISSRFLTPSPSSQFVLNTWYGLFGKIWSFFFITKAGNSVSRC